MKESLDLIRSHYKKVAENFGVRSQSTMQDNYIRSQEELFFKSELERFRGDGYKVMDIGCGNGHIISCLAEKFPKNNYIGMDLTPELIDLADQRKLVNADFFVGDCTETGFYNGEVDIVITNRVIINILDTKEQYQALENMAELLRPGGLYLMCESFKESHAILNQALREMGLKEREESYQNRYLYERMIFKMQKFGLEEIEGTLAKNHLSTHFYTSRVLHPLLRPKGAKVKHTHFVDFFAQALPCGIGNFSPIQFRVFRKN